MTSTQNLNRISERIPAMTREEWATSLTPCPTCTSDRDFDDPADCPACNGDRWA